MGYMPKIRVLVVVGNLVNYEVSVGLDLAKEIGYYVESLGVCGLG